MVRRAGGRLTAARTGAGGAESRPLPTCSRAARMVPAPSEAQPAAGPALMFLGPDPGPFDLVRAWPSCSASAAAAAAATLIKEARF